MKLRPVPQALVLTSNDLERTMRKNQPPILSAQALLGLLQLDGPRPDGKTLGARLLISENVLYKILPPTGESVFAIEKTLFLTGLLLGKLAEKRESENQHAEAENLVAVAERQITREQNICPIATKLYLGVGSNRPEMVNKSVYEELAFQTAMSKVLEMVYDLEKSKKGRSTFRPF